MSEFEHAVIALTENKDTLARLRSMKMLKKDAIKNKEYYSTMYDGRIFDFYAGEPRTFPIDIARALENTNMTHQTDKCPSCKGTGVNAAGNCQGCKGRKSIIKENDEGQILAFRVLKITRVYDAMLIDPAVLQAMSSTPAIEESTVASVAGAA